jgi:catechol 2,3-dioxygenase-like lactoylglutathione lyase family enzyme
MDDIVTGKTKLGPLAQVGVVVREIDKVVEFYSSTFGIGPWEIRDGESEAKVGGQTYVYKTRVAFAQLGPVTLELFEVREGRSPVHAQFLDKDREGVHHLGFYFSREEKEKVIADLAEKGVSVFQDSHIKPSGRTTFLDSAKTGGIFFELIERPAE